MTESGPTIITQARQVLSRGHILWALAIFALAVTLRALWVSYLNLGAGNDGWNFWYAANTLADGNGFRSPWTGDYASNFPPGWPLILASLIYAFGPTFIAAKVFNIIVGAATAVLVYAIAVRLRDQRTGIVAGGLMAVFPSQIYFTTTLMSETLFVTLSAALVLLLTLWLTSKESLRIWQLLAIGLLLGFMSLVRAETVLLGPALLLLLKLCDLPWRTVIQHLLVIAVGMALVITPWTVRNYVRFDQVILIRSQSSNGPFAPIRSGLSPDYKEVVRLGSGVESPTFSESADYYFPEVWRFGAQGWRKLSDFFGNDDHFRYFSEPDYSIGAPVHPLSASEEARWGRLGNVFYYVVAGAALFGAPFWLARRNRQLLIVLWFTASWSLMFLAAVPLTRYHFAIIPMITVLAAAAIVSAWDRFADRKPSREQAGVA